MIEAEGLTKFYGAVPAIKDVGFKIEKGEVVGFLGPNGAGKSTTIRILTCYMPPTAGTARVEGLDCVESSLAVRQKMGYLPENVPLYGDMTVRGFLGFSARAKQVEARRQSREIERVVDLCGLDGVSHRIISHLSKGYRQRVGLAQALIGNPPILVLDEPTIGLDPRQIVEIRNLIRELRSDHTILLSSHILPEVSQICQRVLIINKGRIVATDSPSNLTSRFRKSARIQVQVRDGHAELFPVLSKMDGVLRVDFQQDDWNRFIVETDPWRDLRPEIARCILSHDVDLLELRLIDLSLEDIFMQLVTDESSSGVQAGEARAEGERKELRQEDLRK